MNAITAAASTLPESVQKTLTNTMLLTTATLAVSAVASYMSLGLALTGMMALGLFLGAFAMIFVTQGFSNSWIGIPCLFVFAALMGTAVGPMVGHYLTKAPDAVYLSLGLTGLITLLLSGYTIITKRNFEGIGSYLFGALLILILIMVANIFLQMAWLHLAISYVAVVIFSGYILYDTSEIVHGRETNYISASMNMYLNIINIFIHLLTILGDDD